MVLITRPMVESPNIYVAGRVWGARKMTANKCSKEQSSLIDFVFKGGLGLCVTLGEA